MNAATAMKPTRAIVKRVPNHSQRITGSLKWTVLPNDPEILKSCFVDHFLSLNHANSGLGVRRGVLFPSPCRIVREQAELLMEACDPSWVQRIKYTKQHSIIWNILVICYACQNARECFVCPFHPDRPYSVPGLQTVGKAARTEQGNNGASFLSEKISTRTKTVSPANIFIMYKNARQRDSIRNDYKTRPR